MRKHIVQRSVILTDCPLVLGGKTSFLHVNTKCFAYSIITSVPAGIFY